MSGDQYFINDQHATYFLTLKVVKWVDIFTRVEYRDVVVNSLNFCIENKGLEVNAWVIMSNHIHLIASCQPPFHMSDFLRDFKKFTSKKILVEIQTIHESRREWLLDRFGFEAKRTGRADHYKLWSDDNHAIDLTNTSIDIFRKIDYIHNNPVEAGIVNFPDEYIYSRAVDYANGKGLVKVIVV